MGWRSKANASKESILIALYFMDSFDKKAHWEKIYHTKTQQEFSWYQKVPTTAIGFLNQAEVLKTACIIDVGGGDGYFVDYLLEQGFNNISVLDLSSAALERVKKRLGSKAKKIKWELSDVLAFSSEKRYDFWFDRAVFHFLTEKEEVKAYVKKAAELTAVNGVVVVGTFSHNGPEKCSGIPVKQYNEQEIEGVFSPYFEAIDFHYETHQTPFDTQQEFLFTRFRLKD